MNLLKTVAVLDASEVRLLPNHTTVAIRNQPLITLTKFDAVSSIEAAAGRKIATMIP